MPPKDETKKEEKKKDAPKEGAKKPAPKKEAPKEAPKKEAPKKEAPKKEAPKKEAPPKKETTTTTSTVKQILAVGLKKGHVLKKRKLAVRPVSVKAVKGKRKILAKEVIRDVCGFAPYERRVMELLRNGLEKRALKLSKKKLGTHVSGKRKWTELTDSMRKIREQKQKEAEQQK